MTPCGQQRNDSKNLSLDSFVSLFFFDFSVVTHFAPIRFYKQTTLRTETFIYTEKLLCADTLTQRGLRTDKLLHADASTYRGFYANKFWTQKFLYTDALHKDAFTRINKGTQALLHTEPFTQRNLCTEQFLHKETFTQENFDTEKVAHATQTAQISFYTPKLLHAETLPRAAFTHRHFSAQKPICTEVFMHSSFYTDPFTHRCLYTENNLHTEASAHSTLLHTASLYTERLCFPFLITYLWCSPHQVSSWNRWRQVQGHKRARLLQLLVPSLRLRLSVCACVCKHRSHTQMEESCMMLHAFCQRRSPLSKCIFQRGTP